VFGGHYCRSTQRSTNKPNVGEIVRRQSKCTFLNLLSHEELREEWRDRRGPCALVVTGLRRSVAQKTLLRTKDTGVIDFKRTCWLLTRKPNLISKTFLNFQRAKKFCCLPRLVLALWSADIERVGYSIRQITDLTYRILLVIEGCSARNHGQYNYKNLKIAFVAVMQSLGGGLWALSGNRCNRVPGRYV